MRVRGDEVRVGVGAHFDPSLLELFEHFTDSNRNLDGVTPLVLERAKNVLGVRRPRLGVGLGDDVHVLVNLVRDFGVKLEAELALRFRGPVADLVGGCG